MEHTFNTKFGDITLRNAMLDANGTDLIDGVEIKLDGDLIGEVFGHLNFDKETPIEEIEDFVKLNCDI